MRAGRAEPPGQHCYDRTQTCPGCPGHQKERCYANVPTWSAWPDRRGPMAAVAVPCGCHAPPRDAAGPVGRCPPWPAADLYPVRGRCRCRDGPRGDDWPGGPGHRKPRRRTAVHHHHPGGPRRQQPRHGPGRPPCPGQRHYRHVLPATVGAARPAAPAPDRRTAGHVRPHCAPPCRRAGRPWRGSSHREGEGSCHR